MVLIQVSPWKLLLEGLFKVQMVLPSKVLRLYICSKYEREEFQLNLVKSSRVAQFRAGTVAQGKETEP